VIRSATALTSASRWVDQKDECPGVGGGARGGEEPVVERADQAGIRLVEYEHVGLFAGRAYDSTTWRIGSDSSDTCVSNVD